MTRCKVAFLVLFCVAGSIQEPGPRIIGGDEAAPHAYPYMVLVRGKESPNESYCGGAIVGKRTAITAKHCQLSSMVIVAGEHRLDLDEGTEQVVEVVEFVPHPAYDLAVLKLAEELTMDEYVQPAALPLQGEVFEGEGTLTGWGRIKDGSYPDYLKALNVTILDSETCAPTPHELCAGGVDGEGACFADSGNPLVHEGIVIGLISYGITVNGKCAVGIADYYEQVSYFADFIQENM